MRRLLLLTLLALPAQAGEIPVGYSCKLTIYYPPTHPEYFSIVVPPKDCRSVIKSVLTHITEML